MKVYADFRQKVEIDPRNAIEELRYSYFGLGTWIAEKDRNWFLMTNKSAGTHSYEDKVKKLTEKEVKYYKALDTVEEFLKKKK